MFLLVVIGVIPGYFFATDYTETQKNAETKTVLLWLCFFATNGTNFHEWFLLVFISVIRGFYFLKISLNKIHNLI